MKKYIFLVLLLSAGNYLYTQDTNNNTLIERINMLRLLDKARTFGNTKNEEFLCAMQYPLVSYYKELETKGFHGYKFYICRFNFTIYNCSDSNKLLERETPIKNYIFAISDNSNNYKIYRISGFGDLDICKLVNERIYRVASFDDLDIWELVTNNPYLKSRIKCKKRFLKEYYIEKIDMELFYEIYKSEKKFINKMNKTRRKNKK